jgi:hypothetical protein
MQILALLGVSKRRGWEVSVQRSISGIDNRSRLATRPKFWGTHITQRTLWRLSSIGLP